MKTCPKCHQVLPDEALFCPMDGTSLASAESDPFLGSVIADRYVLLERVGQGKSGTIYRGEHVVLRQKIAVKILHHDLNRDQSAPDRFREEASALAQIKSDHVVRISDFGLTSGNQIFFAMEFLEGETLATILAKEGRFDEVRTQTILDQIGEALSEAHALGFVHRDIRPRNIFICQRPGQKDYVKLLDFGLAKLTEAPKGARTALGTTIGDPQYMSPEQARGDLVDLRSDIYSLAIIGYELINGDPPFCGGGTFDVLSKQLNAQPAPLINKVQNVSRFFSDAILKALNKKKEDRFASVDLFLNALKQQAPNQISSSLSAKETLSDYEQDDITSTSLNSQEGPRTIPYPSGRAQGRPTGATAGAKADKGEAAKTLLGTGLRGQDLIASMESAQKRKGQGGQIPQPKLSTHPDISDDYQDPGRRPEDVAVVNSPNIIKAELATASAGSRKQRTDGIAATSQDNNQENVNRASKGNAAASPFANPSSSSQIQATVPATSPLASSPLSPVSRPEAESSLPLGASEGPEKRDASLSSTGISEAEKTSGQNEYPSASAVSASISRALRPQAVSRSLNEQAASMDPTLKDMPEPFPTDEHYDASSQSGSWFAEGEAAEQELTRGRRSGPLPQIYADAIDDDEVLKKSISSTAIIGAVVAAFAVFLLLFLFVFRKDDSEEKKKVKVVSVLPKESDKALSKASSGVKEKKIKGAHHHGTSPSQVTKAEKKPADKKAALDKKAKKETPKETQPPKRAEEKKAPQKKERQEKIVVHNVKPRTKPTPPPLKKERPQKVATAKKNSQAHAEPKKAQPKESLARDPLGASTHIREGQALIRRGKYDQARDEFLKALKQDSRNAAAHAGLGEVAFELGKYPLAIKHFRTAVLINPNKSRYIVMLGNAYFKRGNTKQAVDQYRRALSKDPNNSAARAGLEAAVRKMSNGG